MKNLVLFALVLLLLPVPLWANSYSTSFPSPPAPENPISESGNWTNPNMTSLWSNVVTTGAGHATGITTPTQYGDATAIVAGSWGPNQTIQETVEVSSACSGANCEVELRPLTTFASNSITGYEINCSVITTNPYIQLVRWNGANGSFTQLDQLTPSQSCKTTDVFKVVTAVSGSTVTFQVSVNGTLQTFTNCSCTNPHDSGGSAFLTGSPGIGFFVNQGNTSDFPKFGISAFSASDGSGGGIINAASCSATDVQTACSAIVASTTQVNIPACSSGVAWTAQVTCTVPSGNTNLSIFGAGSLAVNGGGDQTVIIDNYASNNSLLILNTGSNSAAKFRLAGVTFKGGSGSVKYSGIIQVGGSSGSFRVDHSHISTATYSPAQNSAGMRLNNCVNGVIDHSIFDAPSGSVNNAVQQDQGGSCFSDTLGLGDQSWAHPTNLGSANFLFMENDTFNSGFANDCTWAGRWVMRFNTFNATGNAETIQTHPTGGAGRIRGCRAFEVYQNNFNAGSGSYLNALFWISSGTGVVWGNTAPSSANTGYKTFLLLNSMRTNSATYGQTSPPNGWGYCGTGSGPSTWDQNLDSTGRHCMDQPGMGQGDLLQGGFTSDGSGSNNVCDVTSGQCAVPNYNGSWVNEAVEPIYEWLDTVGQVPSNPPLNWIGSNAAFTNTFVANADYYVWCNASSGSGCTSFNGTAGVGSGVLASRPATCTVGVAYWATDQGSWNQSGSGGQGVLYKCTATNTWTLFYTPYTYPHPLIGGSPPTPTAPTITGTPSITGQAKL
jgi:hypothetical protein